MPVKRGVAIWISGFLTFLASLNSFSAVIYWISRGRDYVFTPYLIGEYTGELQIETYFWISVTVTFIFLGLTCIIAYRKLPPDPEIVKMFVKVGGSLASIKKTVETSNMELADSLENNRKTNQQLFKKADANLENTREEMLNTIEKQEKTMQKVRRDITSTIETRISETKEETLGVLKKHGTTIREVGSLSKQGTAAIKKQKAELKDIKTRLEKIEGALMPVRPRLRSQDDQEEIRGIGPRLGEELKSIGITNVAELIVADPDVIGEKTRASREMAEHLQAMAQLLMVPGVDDNDAELLLDAGVTSRRELADQDLVPLSRKIREIAKNHIEEGKMSEDEKPTIEEISSWIRMAKS